MQIPDALHATKNYLAYAPALGIVILGASGCSAINHSPTYEDTVKILNCDDKVSKPTSFDLTGTDYVDSPGAFKVTAHGGKIAVEYPIGYPVSSHGDFSISNDPGHSGSWLIAQATGNKPHEFDLGSTGTSTKPSIAVIGSVGINGSTTIAFSCLPKAVSHRI